MQHYCSGPRRATCTSDTCVKFYKRASGRHPCGSGTWTGGVPAPGCKSLLNIIEHLLGPPGLPSVKKFLRALAARAFASRVRILGGFRPSIVVSRCAPALPRVGITRITSDYTRLPHRVIPCLVAIFVVGVGQNRAVELATALPLNRHGVNVLVPERRAKQHKNGPVGECRGDNTNRSAAMPRENFLRGFC